jgi:ATP-binding cassette subfamily C (CFTR/MRP) protein 1
VPTSVKPGCEVSFTPPAQRCCKNAGLIGTTDLVKPKSTLIRSLWQILYFHMLVPVLPRILLIALTYCQPLLIKRVLSLQMEPVTESSRNIGYGLIAAYGLVYAGIAVRNLLIVVLPELMTNPPQVLSASYWFLMAKATTYVRGAIASKVFSRINDLSIMNTDDSAAVVLMSTDVERITIGMNMMHETWASVLEVGIGIYLLQQELGMPAFVALGTALGKSVG